MGAWVWATELLYRITQSAIPLVAECTEPGGFWSKFSFNCMHLHLYTTSLEKSSQFFACCSCSFYKYKINKACWESRCPHKALESLFHSCSMCLPIAMCTYFLKIVQDLAAKLFFLTFFRIKLRVHDLLIIQEQLMGCTQYVGWSRTFNIVWNFVWTCICAQGAIISLRLDDKNYSSFMGMDGEIINTV